MNERPLAPFVAVVAIGLLGFFVFPGHTYLHQDSQIYLPMMERIADSRVLGNDLIATHPHLSFTLYDEIALAFKLVFGLDFQPVLVAQQILTRLAGLIGVFLIARAAGASATAMILLCLLYGLGATIVGPSVLTIEYEPTPRSFALPLILCSVGLASVRAWMAAGAVAFFAMLYHPPTVFPVLTVMIAYLLTPWQDEEIGERVRFGAWVLAAVLVVLLAAKLQAGARIDQRLTGLVSPELEKLQRLRAAYVFVGMWFGQHGLHHLVMLAVAIGAWIRAAGSLSGLPRWIFGALPVIGILSLLASYLLMDVIGWGLIPQLQPARAVLWTTLFAILGSGLAAAAAKNWTERMAWLIAPFAIVILTRPLSVYDLRQWALVVALASAGGWVLQVDKPWIAAGFAALAMVAVPYVGGIRNYPVIHSAELDELSAWAKASTPIEAMFHFPDAGKDLYPGIFRARALRAVWVDWKGGGQVNFTESLAMEWWRRWSNNASYKPPAGDFIVRKGNTCPKPPLFANSRYCVYVQD